MNQVGVTALSNEPRRWDFLASLMVEQGYKTFVEIGCKEGRTTGHILANVPDSRVIAIDPWMKQEKSDDPKKETYEAWDFEAIEREFWANVGEHKERCEMLRTTSVEAFGDLIEVRPRMSERFDLVFIDALHDYEHVMEDIRHWWCAVRPGGILAGHDFNHKWPGVERAVAESFNLMQVGVGPDSVWFVVKGDEEQFRGA